MKHYFVYVITHKASGTAYVGFSSNPTARWAGHRYRAHNEDRPTRFYRALRRDGQDAFDWTVHSGYWRKEDALGAEVMLIAQFRDTPTGVYNITEGGETPAVTEEMRKKMSAAARRPDRLANLRARRVGVPMSADQRAKLSATHKGKKVSDAVRANLLRCAKRKGRRMSQKAKENMRKAWTPERRRLMSERGLSPETRAKLSASLKGKPKSEEHKQKLASAQRGKRLTAETKRKISAANKGRVLSKKRCSRATMCCPDKRHCARGLCRQHYKLLHRLGLLGDADGWLSEYQARQFNPTDKIV